MSIVAGVPALLPTRSPRARRLPHGIALGLLLGLVATGLLLARLRMESVNLRYRLAEVHAAERAAQEEQRQLTLEVRRLRHPLALSERGRALGLAPPARIVDLSQGPAGARSGAPTP